MAIAIPVFTGQLEKSRESTDIANIRNAYAENLVGILEDPSNTTLRQTEVDFQQQAGWQNSTIEDSLNALAVTNAVNGDLDVEVTGTPSAGGKATFAYTVGTATANPKVTITIS